MKARNIMQTHVVQKEALLHQLNWRYATKKFDPTRKISDEDWNTLEQALVLTPSSFGLQPWKFVVVKNPAIRGRLVAVSWDQRQVVDASHLVVFAIKGEIGEPEIQRYLERISKVRSVPLASLQNLRDALSGFLRQPKSEFDPQNWAARQAYIALGNFITSAALLGIDTCPMEGIEPQKYDEILGLDKQGYHTLFACPAGYRAADDKYAALAKVRFDHNEVITRVE